MMHLHFFELRDTIAASHLLDTRESMRRGYCRGKGIAPQFRYASSIKVAGEGGSRQQQQLPQWSPESNDRRR